MCATTDTPALIAGLALALHLMDEQTFKRHSLRAAVASISPSFARQLRDDRTPRVCFKGRPMDLFGAVCAAKMYWEKDAIAKQLQSCLKESWIVGECDGGAFIEYEGFVGWFNFYKDFVRI